MSIKQVNPYIHFNGTAEKAIKLYENALGAKTETVMRYSDAPGACAPNGNANLILHAAVRIGAGMVMVSDTQPDRPVATRSNVQVALDFLDPDTMEKAFAALAAGGKVAVSPQDMFWGAKFGMLTDAFGVQWMFNCELKK